MGNRSKRTASFRRYAKNLSFYARDVGNIFRCPVCTNPFGPGDIDKLSMAHVFPLALGGTLQTLACTKCDSEIGSKCDRELADMYFLADGLAGRSVIHGKATVDGHKVAAVVKISGDHINIEAIESRSNPKHFAELLRIAKGNGLGTVTFSMTKPVDEPMAYLAILHVAHLAMFRAFGYEYCYAETAEAIQRALIRGDTGLSSRLIRILDIPHWNAKWGQVAICPAIGSCLIGLKSYRSTTPALGVLVPGLGPLATAIHQRKIVEHGGALQPFSAMLVDDQKSLDWLENPEMRFWGRSLFQWHCTE